MKLGGLSINESEGRLLIKLALVEACLDLNGKLEAWKIMTDESWDAADEQYLTHYNRVVDRCLDVLAKLIGLLQLDGLIVERL